jgi:Uncharacterised nucleotidyltransferase
VIRLQRKPGTFLPTPEQHHLLRAALLRDPARVRESFAAWKAAVHIDRIDQGAMRLLPLLYRNLQRAGIDDPLLPRLKGVYRQVWFRNQLILDHGRRALRSLAEAGIPTIALKGAALVQTVYAEPALRPMEDFDILVPREHFARAVDVLRGAAWSFQPPLADPAPHFAFQHAVGFKRDGGGELDLHWTAMGLAAEGWPSAKGLLAPADQLLQICTHATRFNPDIPPIRWAADAFLLLEHEAFPWDEMGELARERGLSLVMLRSLEYLRDGLDLDVPDGVMSALERATGFGERMALALRNAGGRLVYVQFFVDWMSNVRSLRQLLLLPRFLRSYCRVDTTASLLRLVTSRLAFNTRRARG